MHDDVNEMKTDLKAEKKKTQNTKWTDDKKVSKEIMKLKKDLNKQKESNKKLESGITNREKKISHLQNSNLQLEKENLDLKARLEELDKPMSQKYERFGSATTQATQGVTTISELFN